MRWNYTKTLLILVAAATAIRLLPALFGHDPFGPDSIGGGPAAGMVWLVLLGPIFVAADIIAWRRRGQPGATPGQRFERWRAAAIGGGAIIVAVVATAITADLRDAGRTSQETTAAAFVLLLLVICPAIAAATIGTFKAIAARREAPREPAVQNRSVSERPWP